MRLITHVLILSMLPACALAQGQSDAVHQRNDCRMAVQIVTTGNPAPHTVWAYEQISECGPEGAAAVAAAIRRNRRNTDLAALDAITGSARTVRDAEVYDASLEVAGDGTASIPARVLAFRTVISTLSPGRLVSYDQMTRPDVQRACAGLLPSGHEVLSEGRTLPADAVQQGRAVALAVSEQPGVPDQVKQAASCALRYTR